MNAMQNGYAPVLKIKVGKKWGTKLKANIFGNPFNASQLRL